MRNWTIPRWFARAWLWVNVPASILQYYGLPGENLSEISSAFGNTVGNAFGLFPMALAWWFPQGAPRGPLWLILIILTGVCDWLLVKRAPKAIPAWIFVLGVVVWFALSWLTNLTALVAIALR